MEYRTINNGIKMPVLGFGVFQVSDPRVCEESVLTAIRHGYRLIDTASVYGTERAVGKAVRACGISRDALVITTKAWRTELGYDQVMRAFERSLGRLDMDYIDLYLLHWPARDDDVDRDSWRAMERLYDEGVVKAIGVSNYLTHHLQNILAVCNVLPMVDQIEFHPGYLQQDTVEFALNNGICMEAWSPLGRQRLNEEPQLLALAASHGTTVQAICLAFVRQSGLIPLPKSSSAERMRENLKSDITLTSEEMDIIRGMLQCGWSGEHPDVAPDKDVKVPD